MMGGNMRLRGKAQLVLTLSYAHMLTADWPRGVCAARLQLL